MDFRYDPNLVLYVPLNELDGTSFMSRDKYGRLCTVTGALWRPDGRFFDGIDDLISIPDTTALRFGTGDFTVGGWGKVTGDNDDYQGLISKGMPTGAGKWALSTNSNNMDGVNFYADNGGISCGIATGGFEDNAWHCAMFVRNGNNGTLYFDGTSVKTVTGIGAINLNTNVAVQLGCRGSDATSYWQGVIGAAWVYNRALTPIEVQYNYLTTKWRYR